MKNKEADYLNQLFAKSSDEVSETEVDFPLIDVPAPLTDNLYAISESSHGDKALSKQNFFKPWPLVASIAASFLVAVVLVQVYQQQQTLKQLQQAQSDLSTALHYLAEANQITQANIFNTLNSNMKKATVKPVIEIGRDAVLPTLKSLEPETKTPSRTL